MKRSVIAVFLVLALGLTGVPAAALSASEMPPPPTPPPEPEGWSMDVSELVLANAGTAPGADVTDAPLAVEQHTIVVGQPRAGGGAGAVLVFNTDDDDLFGNQTTLTSPVAGQLDFGAAVSIRDGAILATAFDPVAATPVVHRFLRSGSGSYNHDLQITSPSTAAIAATSTFVSVAATTDTIVVTERVDLAPGTSHPYGLVHVFAPDNVGAAALIATEVGGRTSPDPFYGNGDSFGDSLAASSTHFVVGDPYSMPGASGAVFLFTPDGAGGFIRTELISTYGPEPDNEWGAAVAINTSAVAASATDYADLFTDDGSGTFVLDSSPIWSKVVPSLGQIALSGRRLIAVSDSFGEIVNMDSVAFNGIAAHNDILVYTADDDIYVLPLQGRCFGLLPTVTFGPSYPDKPTTPTEGDDVVVGFIESEVDGLGGNDTMCVIAEGETSGLFFDYEIFGGPGNDRIEANRVNGGTGNDVLVGIHVSGDQGNDRIFTSHDGYGGPGNDTIIGRFLRGGTGNDTLFPTDRGWGEDGNDRIVGSNQANRLFGGEGDDRLWGRGDDDELAGGPGRDRISGGNGDDTIEGNEGSDWIYGGPGRDAITGSSGADQIWGDGGNDTVFGGGGLDRIWGGAGDDTLQGNHNSDIIFGGDGNDTLRGAAGKDRLFGEDGDDQLFGGDNSDWLNGGTGTDYGDGQRGKENPLDPGVRGCVNLASKVRC